MLRLPSSRGLRSAAKSVIDIVLPTRETQATRSRVSQRNAASLLPAVVQGKKLHVNKTVLSLHSNYFDTLFKSDSKEEIPIESVNFDVFAILMSLVHNAPMKFNESQVEKLLELANRFELPAAKAHIELWLMSPQKPNDYKIKMADKYKLDDLMDMAMSKFDGSSSFYHDDFLRNSVPRFDIFDQLSDETNVKLYHRLLTFSSGERVPPYSRRQDDWRVLYSNEPRETDAILVVGENQIRVNKALLSYHSDYFKTLFNSDFKEKSMPEIPIEDVDFDEFATLLNLVLPEPVLPNDDEDAEYILELADRFTMPSVKRLIELFLISLNMNNVHKLRIAERFGMEDLLESGIDSFGGKYELQQALRQPAYSGLSDKTKKKMFYKYLNI